QVLEEIATDHFMPSMFARTRDSSAPAVSRTLRQLLEKDLVAVSVSPDDGRQRKYALTAKGTRTMARLRAARQDAIDAIWMDLAPAHVRAFTRFAQKLSDRLERYLVDTGGPSSARPLRGLRASDAPGPPRPSVAPRGAGLLLDQRDRGTPGASRGRTPREESLDQ